MSHRWIGLAARPHAHRARLELVKFERAPKRFRAKRALNVAGWVGVGAAALFFQLAVFPDALASYAPAEQFADIQGPPLDPVPLIAAKPGDERLLAATMWAEARSEGEHGMRAVAHVMVNRVGARFGDDLRTVILAPKQFSAWNRGDPNRPLALNPDRYARGGDNLETWEAAQRIAREVLEGQSVDPTEGALFYHTRAVRPSWSRQGEGRQTIGQHIFYRDVPDRRERHSVRLIAARPDVDGAAETQVAVVRGPRAGRVNGVIQYAPSNWNERQATAATPAPVTSEDIPAPVAAPVATSVSNATQGVLTADTTY